MSLDATPTVTVAGTAVGLSAASSGTLVGIEALSIPWGRSTVLDQPTPARLSLRLLDRSTGGAFARRADLIGQVVTVGWAGSDGGSGTSFRGRVTDVELTPLTRRDPAGMLRRMLAVDVAATSLELDAANYTVPEQTPPWPTEDLASRAARIAALFPAGLFAAVELDPAWSDVPPSAATVDVSGKSALDLLRQLANSTARPLVYDPTRNALTYCARRKFTAAHATRLEAVPAYGGLRAATCSPVGGVWLPAARLVPGGPAARGLASRLTRVEVRYYDNVNAEATAAYAIPTDPPEAVGGRRTLSVDSVLTGATPSRVSGTLAGEWGSIASNEALQPTAPPLSWRSADGWWDTTGQRALMLAGCEQPTPVFVQGSEIPEVGASPLVGFVGGVIAYGAGDWTVQLHPVGTFPQPAPGLTAASFTSTGLRPVDLHRSVSFADCPYIQEIVP